MTELELLGDPARLSHKRGAIESKGPAEIGNGVWGARNPSRNAGNKKGSLESGGGGSKTNRANLAALGRAIPASEDHKPGPGKFPYPALALNLQKTTNIEPKRKHTPSAVRPLPSPKRSFGINQREWGRRHLPLLHQGSASLEE